MSDEKENYDEKNDPQISPTSQRRSNRQLPRMWVAVIIALIVIIGALGGVLISHYIPTTKAAPSATVSAQIGAISQGNTYTTQINATSSFKNMVVYYGDGTSSNFSYHGSKSVNISHTYNDPGSYYIFADINYGSSVSQYIQPVKVTANIPSAEYAYRPLTVNLGLSSAQLLNNFSNIFTPGSHMTLNFVPNPGAGNNQIVSQSLEFSNLSGTVSSEIIPYNYGLSSQSYGIPVQSVAYGGLNSGMYTLEVNTTTASLNTTQTVTATVYSESVQNFTTGQTYISSQGTTLSNLSGAYLNYQRANLTYSNGTADNFTGSFKMFLDSPTNITLNYGTLNYRTGSKTGSMTDGESATLNATSVITGASGTNISFNRATSLELNSSSSGFDVYGSQSNITSLNSTIITFLGTINGVGINETLKGTTTIPLNNGQYNQQDQITTTYFEDFPVVSSLKQTGSSGSTFTNAELAAGGYTTLDPSIAYAASASEVLDNTLMTLDTYNGSSTNSFIPLLAAKLPSVANGGINTNYVNKSVTTPWGSNYYYNVTPGENYTFFINNNTKFANGSPATAWDVQYTFTRTLLFAADPDTPGWILAQYMMPGNYYETNSFYNITTNMTVDNATNSITIHFQQPMSPSLVFQLFVSDGTWVEPAAWYQAHGAGIKWSVSGFNAYKSEGVPSNYNTYIQNHVLSDGAYTIAYIVPSTQVTLLANPSFNSPGKFFPKPSIDRINLLYYSQANAPYLLLKSNQAQSASIPTSNWNEVQALTSAGKVNTYSFPTLSIQFYTFNLNINVSMLSSISSSSNLPSGFFMNPNVRKAFAYAYNYSEYFDYQAGNKIYNTTFLSPYVGMLPPGMLYNQTSMDLVHAGTSVVNQNGTEFAQVSKARTYWDNYLNSSAADGAKAEGVQTSGNSVTYKSNPLVIPIFIPEGDPVDKAGAVTWAKYLSEIIPGAKFPVVTVTYYDIYVGYPEQGANPMPIAWGSWIPDYPYPTDYELPMGMPLNASSYMGPSGYTLFWLKGGNKTISNPYYNMSEYRMAASEVGAFNNASSNATNSSAAKHWFQTVNGMIVNSTMQVYIGQFANIWIMSSNVNGNDVLNYEENVMLGGGGYLIYNYLGYNGTK